MQEELEKAGIPSKVIFDAAVGCVGRQQEGSVTWHAASRPSLCIYVRATSTGHEDMQPPACVHVTARL